MGLQGFVFSLKHWSRSDDETDSDRINEEGDNPLKYIAITVLFESVLQLSAPEFIIQLYAMNAQEEPVMRSF